MAQGILREIEALDSNDKRVSPEPPAALHLYQIIGLYCRKAMNRMLG
jgi:hypothetical protein